MTVKNGSIPTVIEFVIRPDMANNGLCMTIVAGCFLSVFCRDADFYKRAFLAERTETFDDAQRRRNCD